jgi:hypothetical protein
MRRLVPQFTPCLLVQKYKYWQRAARRAHLQLHALVPTGRGRQFTCLTLSCTKVQVLTGRAALFFFVSAHLLHQPLVPTGRGRQMSDLIKHERGHLEQGKLSSQCTCVY